MNNENRPACLWCGKLLIWWVGAKDWGCEDGGGFFCSIPCGLSYAVHAAGMRGDDMPAEPAGSRGREK